MIFPKRSMQKPSFWATETIFNSCPAGVAKDQNPLKTQSISSLPAWDYLSIHEDLWHCLAWRSQFQGTPDHSLTARCNHSPNLPKCVASKAIQPETESNS
jgi:hypothetical protein